MKCRLLTPESALVLFVLLDIISVFSLAISAELSPATTTTHNMDSGGQSQQGTLRERLMAFRHEAVDLAALLVVRVLLVLCSAFPLVRHFKAQRVSVASAAEAAALAPRCEEGEGEGEGEGEAKTAGGAAHNIQEEEGGARTVRTRDDGDREEEEKTDERKPLLSSGHSNGQPQQQDSPPTTATVPVTTAAPGGSGDEFGKERTLAALRQRQDKLKVVAIAVCFLIITVSGVVTSIKCLFFVFSSLSPSVRHTQRMLFGLSVLWINVELFALGGVLRKGLKDADAHLEQLHRHPLCFRTDITATKCDLCNFRVKREGFDCLDCDFTICLQCFRKKTNAQGENLLTRTDKGVSERDAMSNASVLLRALRFVLPFKGMVAVALLCLLGAQAARLVLPNYQGRIIDAVVRRELDSFWLCIKLYSAMSVATLLLGGVKQYCVVVIIRKVRNHVRVQLFRSLLDQDMAFFDGTTVGALSSRMTNDAAKLLSPLRIFLSSVLGFIIQLIGGLVVCLTINWSLALISLTMVGPILYITGVYAKFSRTLSRRTLDIVAEENNTINEAFANMRTVRALSTEQSELAKYKGFCDDVLYKAKQDALASAGAYSIATLLDLGAMTLILGFGGWMVMMHPDELSVGELVTFQLYAGMINNAYQGINNSLNQFTQSAGASERIFAMLDAKPAMGNSSGKKLPPPPPTRTGHRQQQEQRHALEGDITLEHVWFAYPMRPKKFVLRDVSLRFPKNRVTAVVGKSGSGKSTVCSHLLLRMYDPTKGRILVDGEDLAGLNVPWYHSHMAVVAQETQLFASSVEENIRYGMPDAAAVTHADVVRAATLANATEFIDTMDEGFRTTVGERGVRLSGGQRQRLAIARAFLRRPQILLLDEATSALDAESEAAVQDAIDNLVSDMCNGCTIIIVAHRLSTVVKADNIIVLEDGTVAEQGTHRSLIQRDGVYARLVARQLQGYSSDSAPENTDERHESQQQQQEQSKSEDDASEKKHK